MIDIDWKPSARKLRQFAIASLFGFPLIGLLLNKLLPFVNVTPPGNLMLVCAIIGGVTCVLGLVMPKLITPVYLALIIITLPIGFIVGWLLLPLIYYTVFTPMGLCMRLFGWDAMDRKLDKSASTYWSERKPMPAPASYYRQY